MQRDLGRPSGDGRAESVRYQGELSPAVAGGVLEVPGDLGAWAGPGRLLRWVLEEVVNLDCYGCEEAWDSRACASCQPRVMAALLAFAYARQMYDTEEIAQSRRMSPMLGVALSGRAPFPEELRCFRRRQRTFLGKVLTRVFIRAIQYRFDLGGTWITPELEQDVQRLAEERLNIAHHMDEVECC